MLKNKTKKNLQNSKNSKKSKKQNQTKLQTKLQTKHHITSGHPLVQVIRDDIIESLHSGHLIILDASCNTILSLGKTDFLMYPRSAIKAIQASAMVRNGFNLDGEYLALASSSHIGSQLHQNKVKEMLATVGLDESVLQNTPFRPMIPDSNDTMRKKPTSLAAPCSGKHAGMIITSKLNGWDISTYKDINHPMQIACKEELEMLSREKITKIAIDGCTAPLFAITLKGLATAIHNLMISKDPVHQKVVNACKNFPEMVSGKGTLPTVAMQMGIGTGMNDDLFVKTGAEGVMVAGLSDGSTIVWKISDGSDRGESELLSASLKKLGVVLNFNFYKEHDVVIRANI